MEPFLGQIMMFGGNFAVRGWALCDGQLMPISQNSALFSILGTMYGGDGRTTFALPDLRGRSPLHWGQGPGLSHVRQGQKGGAEAHTMSSTEMPSHTHAATLHAENKLGTVGNPTGNMLARSGASNIYAPEDVNDNKVMSSESVIVSNTGGSQPFGIRSPYLGVTFLIALQGTFPSRS